MPVIGVLGLLGAGGAVLWSVGARPNDAFVAREVADSFNLQTGPAPSRAFPSPAAPAPVASSLIRPIADAEMAVAGAPKAAAKNRFSVVTPKAESWARRHEFMAGLIAEPADFLRRRGSLGSARGLRAFLSDPRKVDAYMNSAIVRVTLNSPAVAKALLGNPAVIRAFLATPALRDPKAVRALVSSPMLRKMLDCPAIQEALGDPAVMKGMLADPQTVSWIAANPRALTAVAEAVPSLGASLATSAR